MYCSSPRQGPLERAAAKSEAAPVWRAPDRRFRAVPDVVAAQDVLPAEMALPEAELPEVVLLSASQLEGAALAAAWDPFPQEADCSRKGERRARHVWGRIRKPQERSRREAQRVGVSAFYAFGTGVALASRDRVCGDSI